MSWYFINFIDRCRLMSKLKTSRCCTQTRQQISQSACYCSASCQPTHSASFFTDNLCLHLRNARTRLTCPRVLRGTPGAWALFGFGLYVGLNRQNNTFVLLCCLILFCWIWNTLMHAFPTYNLNLKQSRSCVILHASDKTESRLAIYMSRMLYAGQSARQIVTFLSDF